MRINQMLPAWHDGDATGDNALALMRFFAGQGFESNVFYIDADPPRAPLGIPSRRFAEYDTEDAINILHYAIPSFLSHQLHDAKGKKVMIYHNVTPAKYFKELDEVLVRMSIAGRDHLAYLKETVDLALADSAFNESELKERGFQNTDVLPFGVDYSKFDVPDNPVLKSIFDDGRFNILHVGRISPNKCYEDILKIFAILSRTLTDRARLIMVGKFDHLESYYYRLLNMAERLHLHEAYFMGKLDHRDLCTLMRNSHLLISMSEHEGFCVPLLEANYFGLPIIAYAAGAIPDTLQNAGILIHKKDHATIAELIFRIMESESLYESLCSLAPDHHKKWDISKTGRYLMEILKGQGFL